MLEGTADWRLRHLAEADSEHPDRPAERAYHAMAAMVSHRFLHLTRAERARQVHLGPRCGPDCDLCWDIALAHAVWAANKVRRQLRDGPPRTSRGEEVRDWVRIMEWIRTPPRDETEVAAVRHAFFHRLPPNDPLLPLVHAVATQLLPSASGARTMRRTSDFVGDARRSVLAQRQGWSVKPGRDLSQRVTFAGFRARHPRGIELLRDVLKRLDHGAVDPYQAVLGREGTSEADRAALLALLRDMFADDAARDWFQREVDARQSYNEDLARRRYRPIEDVDGLTDPEG